MPLLRSNKGHLTGASCGHKGRHWPESKFYHHHCVITLKHSCYCYFILKHTIFLRSSLSCINAPLHLCNNRSDWINSCVHAQLPSHGDCNTCLNEQASILHGKIWRHQNGHITNFWRGITFHLQQLRVLMIMMMMIINKMPRYWETLIRIRYCK